jgi:hypothetical protein
MAPGSASSVGWSSGQSPGCTSTAGSRVRYERRDDIHEAFLAIGCSLICLKLLQADESF